MDLYIDFDKYNFGIGLNFIRQMNLYTKYKYCVEVQIGFITFDINLIKNKKRVKIIVNQDCEIHLI